MFVTIKKCILRPQSTAFCVGQMRDKTMSTWIPIGNNTKCGKVQRDECICKPLYMQVEVHIRILCDNPVWSETENSSVPIRLYE